MGPAGVLRPSETPVEELQPRVSADNGCARVRASGKLFSLAGSRWFVKGLTYGPFAPNSAGEFLPERPQLRRDFAHQRQLGVNCIRLYHVPPVSVLDDALEHGLRVLVDVPWEKHRCFFEDWNTRRDALAAVRSTAETVGNHPGVFAISVANEIPHDIVRFYGTERVRRFLDELLAAAKERAPECLVTYTNYPSTEFLQPTLIDFYCANVYLDREDNLRRYLDRLQHVAGTMPLILGEYGVDSFRHSAEGQCNALSHHVRQVFSRGLAGSFVFSYTDDWYTGGHRVEDWAFGITTRDREPKPAAAALKRLWARVPRVEAGPLPKVSVVVCSYNGAATLRECLESLRRLEYPDYEVILVDDGSTDATREIAADFPETRYLHQENLGLSAARNAGLHAATGEVVAYTDSDCIADETWLLYLLQAMRDQHVDAIGGPNVPPPSDSWTAKCVAASPGGPSHVMLDDQHAEHIPGCNMAFRRERLLAVGGFDVRFRQAGDDVDICWRFIDAGLTIGYAASALVWHHRRATVRAYLRQQKGYGRSEAMLHYKHPHRFNMLGCSRWHGIIYGEGAVGLPLASPEVYHGRFGSGLFQIIYRHNRYSTWAYFTLLEWHALALMFAVLAVAWSPLLAVGAAMWALTLAAAVRSAVLAPLPREAPWWCRPTVMALHVLQPLSRSFHRYLHRFTNKRLPRSLDIAAASATAAPPPQAKRISWREHDLYWSSQRGVGREQLLEALAARAEAEDWSGDLMAEWKSHDLELQGDLWHNVRVRTATEELGWPKRFTRVRCSLHATAFTRVAACVVALGPAAALVHRQAWAVWPAAVACAVVAGSVLASRRRCQRAVSQLVNSAGLSAGLVPVAAGSAAGDRAASAAPRGRPAAGRDGEEDESPMPAY